MAELNDYGLGRGEIAGLVRRAARVIYVIGDSDTGKSTLVGCIARRLAPAFKTAAVDLDAGQATIGLPTTFGWQMCTARGYGAGTPGGLYFTGTTSPRGHFDLSVAGAAAMVGEAWAHARKVVVDTCGLACGEAGRELHHATVEAVRPDVIVAIERHGELSELVEPLVRSGWPEVIRASAPAGVRTRSRARRRSYRCAKFREYFKRARALQLSLDKVGILRPRPDPVGRIASLRDGRGRDVALAIVQKCGSPRGTITVLSPIASATKVRAVVLGSLRIARDGRQLARDV